MKILTLTDVLIHGLADIANAEKQIVKALPKFARAARYEPLTERFEQHEKQMEERIELGAQSVTKLSLKLPRIKCAAVEVMIEENHKIIREIKLSSVRDVLLITGTLKIIMYGIAAYSGLQQVAQTLGHKDIVKLLGESARDEKSMYDSLVKMSHSAVNAEALRFAGKMGPA